MSYLIVLCGGTGEGKTTFARELCKGNKHLAVDYGDDFVGFDRFTDVHDMDKFLTLFEPKKEKVKDSIIIIDEATICFNNHRYSDELNAILVRKRHSKNTYVLLFHSLRQIPLFIKDFIDFIVLFKTNDNYTTVKNFPKSDELATAIHKLKSYETNNRKPPAKHYSPITINLK